MAKWLHGAILQYLQGRTIISVQFFNALQTLVMINQGGERICAGLAEKGQAYPFKFPLLLYQKFEIQRRNYHLKSSHALYKKAGGTHIFILLVFYR